MYKQLMGNKKTSFPKRSGGKKKTQLDNPIRGERSSPFRMAGAGTNGATSEQGGGKKQGVKKRE